ncbi:SKP1-like protein 21 [Apostasia shenzhenica]|uniref:SKP1-like protein 21 n=1 Tax=Apostasia shenzhenica TaxID=1088818 RepID=A0A2I0AV11_9ASPA|nr:SKP1-like protein 21 [Apostasia shenzhenica]
MSLQAMKSYVWLQMNDGSTQQVEEEVAMFCPMICRERLHSGMGSSKSFAIALPERVNPAIFSLVLDYCRFHQTPGRSNKERKSFDEKFVRTDTKQLCELASAADSLQLRSLVDLTSRALARIIEGRTPEEIREIFHLPDDLTEEEKLEPLRNATNDPRIRLLNRLYAKKRKELKERQRLKDLEADTQVDERSVDDLLSFINGEDGDSNCSRSTKNKKKSRRRRDLLEESTFGSGLDSKQEESSHSMRFRDSKARLPSNSIQSSETHDVNEDIFHKRLEFDDEYVDDDLDPAMKEELDREVEDFARRLNSNWLSLRQERRLVPNIMNGSSLLPRCAGK